MRNTIRRLAAVAAATAALTAFAALPAGAQSVWTGDATATSNPWCGSVITQSIVLNHDITGCTGNGLSIRASNITVDLNGHTVSGMSGSGSGIHNLNGETAVPISGVTIKNGVIRGFFSAITLDQLGNSSLTGLRLTDNGAGVQLFHSRATTVESSVIDASGWNGIYLSGSESISVRRNDIRNSRAAGIMVVGSRWNNFTQNSIVSNGISGIHLNPQGTQFPPMTCGRYGCGSMPKSQVAGNTVSANGRDGIRVEDGGTNFQDNRAERNAENGIDAVAGVTSSGGNRASGNGSTQCVNVVCTP